MANSEICCDRCSHGSICMYRKNFIEAQKAVDKTVVSIGEQESIFLKDMNFIRPVELSCRHYYSKNNIRNYDGVEEIC